MHLETVNHNVCCKRLMKLDGSITSYTIQLVDITFIASHLWQNCDFFFYCHFSEFLKNAIIWRYLTSYGRRRKKKKVLSDMVIERKQNVQSLLKCTLFLAMFHLEHSFPKFRSTSGPFVFNKVVLYLYFCS